MLAQINKQTNNYYYLITSGGITNVRIFQCQLF